MLLILSNVFMTLAWYGHLKLQETGVAAKWPLLGVIAFSWGIAFFEYCCQVPANRLGFMGNGGPFNLVQLRLYRSASALVYLLSLPTSCFKGRTCIGTIYWLSF